MSFFSNFQSDKCPGSISGNPLNGMCEKVCIQAQKIFDACIKQIQIENYTLTLTDQVPSDPTYPLTFISARSTTSTGNITNLNVERLADKPGCARVQATVSIPVEVLYTDANGVVKIIREMIMPAFLQEVWQVKVVAVKMNQMGIFGRKLKEGGQNLCFFFRPVGKPLFYIPFSVFVKSSPDQVEAGTSGSKTGSFYVKE